jgi:hypothetical protein
MCGEAETIMTSSEVSCVFSTFSLIHLLAFAFCAAALSAASFFAYLI